MGLTILVILTSSYVMIFTCYCIAERWGLHSRQYVLSTSLCRVSDQGLLERILWLGEIVTINVCPPLLTLSAHAPGGLQ